MLYQELTPDRLLNAVESAGLRCDGRMLALNSYENRVYQVGIEDGVPLIVKFYRPNRWPDEAILEEHAFTLELAEREIPVVAPLVDEAGRTLHEFEGFRFALFPRRAGRTPELDDPDTLEWMGRFIGRIHAVGAIRPFQHRPTLNIESFGDEPFHFLMEHGFIPRELEPAYRSVAEDVLAQVRQCYAQTPGIENIRLHGDCHAGNILWSGAGPHFVDFDDCRMAPAVQDLWMLLSGDRAAMTTQLSYIVDGYSEFHDFNSPELRLVEALRTLRIIHYSGWLARRWEDPAFKMAFPWFNTQHYWQEQILALREQMAALDESPLSLGF
ncbi:MAG: serine/threonine protein kinase [Gammaproteobacteria bacterium]|nr:serine/threonine protein kinase [Gammaproteobacteria bacterium]